MTELFHTSAFDWDKQLFQFINSHHSPFWDQVMQVITSAQFGVVFFLILSAMTIYFYRKKAWKILLCISRPPSNVCARHTMRNITGTTRSICCNEKMERTIVEAVTAARRTTPSTI